MPVYKLVSMTWAFVGAEKFLKISTLHYMWTVHNLDIEMKMT